MDGVTARRGHGRVQDRRNRDDNVILRGINGVPVVNDRIMRSDHDTKSESIASYGQAETNSKSAGRPVASIPM